MARKDKSESATDLELINPFAGLLIDSLPLGRRTPPRRRPRRDPSREPPAGWCCGGKGRIAEAKR